MRRITYYIVITFSLLTSISLFASQIEIRNSEPPPKTTNYNLKFGNLELDLGYIIAVVSDSNSNRSGDSDTREEGFRIGNGLTIGLDWSFNPHIRINSGVRIGYFSTTGGEGLEGLVVDGTDGNLESRFLLDFLIGLDGIFTLEEKISRSIDSIEISRLTTAGDFTLWNNSVSLQYQNQLSTYITSAIKVTQSDSWVDEKQFEFKDNTKNSFDILFSWQVNNSLQLRPFARYDKTKFDEEINNDAEQYEFGISANYNVTQSIKSSISLGYQTMDIDPENSENIPLNFQNAHEQEDGFSGNVMTTMKISDFVDFFAKVDIRRTVGISRIVNFSEDITTTSNLKWKFAPRWSFDIGFQWLKANESGSNGEIGDTYTSSARISHEVSKQSKMSLAYFRTDKYSNIVGPDREYERNQITLNLEYDF